MSEVEKSGENSGGNRPGTFLPGDDPRRGNGPPKGSGGRPPNEFKAAMQELASREEALAKVREVLNNPDHPHWLGAYRFAAEHGYGKPAQTIQGPDGGPVQVQVVNAPKFRAE